MASRKAIIYGGTFDPIHEAHIAIIKTLDNEFDKVYVVPTTITYYKSHDQLFTFQERCDKIKEALRDKGLKHTKIDDIELFINNKDGCFADTLKYYLRMTQQPTEWYVALGADSFIDLKTWKDWEYIRDNSHLVVFNRPGCKVEDFPKDIPYTFHDEINMDISSTQIRNELKYFGEAK